MWLYHRVMSPNDADRMANSVDPDQTVPLGAVWSGSALFAQTCLSENLGKLWYCKFTEAFKARNNSYAQGDVLPALQRPRSRIKVINISSVYKYEYDEKGYQIWMLYFLRYVSNELKMPGLILGWMLTDRQRMDERTGSWTHILHHAEAGAAATWL